MATLTLTVTYLGLDAKGDHRYDFAVYVDWEGETPHNIINLYYSLEGAPWGYMFLFQVGTGQTGSATQEYALGSHITGKQVTFQAGVEGIIASNQVSIIVGEDGPPPEEDVLPLIAGAGLAIADAALVVAYLATVFGLI